MSDQSAEFEAGELLRAIGKLPMPDSRVLDDAREVLWSAIASEMLGIGPAGDRTTATQRRQTDRSRGERRMSMDGGDPDR